MTLVSFTDDRRRFSCGRWSRTRRRGLRLDGTGRLLRIYLKEASVVTNEFGSNLPDVPFGMACEKERNQSIKYGCR